VLICQDTVNNKHSFENKKYSRLHMFVLNCLLNITRSQYRYSVFLCTNTRDSPLLCHCPASVQQKYHLPPLAYLHMSLNIVSPITNILYPVKALFGVKYQYVIWNVLTNRHDMTIGSTYNTREQCDRNHVTTLYAVYISLHHAYVTIKIPRKTHC
jgi:hypothetical protein